MIKVCSIDETDIFEEREVKEIKRYAKYACGKNGVTKDGHTMFIKDMVKDLNRKSYLEEQYTDHKAVVETMQKRIYELEADLKEMCKALTDTINYGSICEFDSEYKKAEEILTKFDN